MSGSAGGKADDRRECVAEKPRQCKRETCSRRMPALVTPVPTVDVERSGHSPVLRLHTAPKVSSTNKRKATFLRGGEIEGPLHRRTRDQRNPLLGCLPGNTRANMTCTATESRVFDLSRLSILVQVLSFLVMLILIRGGSWMWILVLVILLVLVYLSERGAKKKLSATKEVTPP